MTRLLADLVLLFGAAAFAGILVVGAWGVELEILIPVTLWCLSPLAAIWALGRGSRAGTDGALRLAAALAAVGFGTVSFVEAMFFDVDAQAGLAFVVAPIVLWGIAGLAAVCAAILRRVRRRAGASDQARME